jgi:LacI family transcriptional regulator
MVREEVRESVLWAVDRLGYIPHGPARALARRRSASVGVIIPSLRFTVYAELVESLQARLGEAGLSMLLGHAGNDLRFEHEQALALVTRGVDALVLIGNRHSDAVVRIADNTALPVVTAFGFDPHSRYPCAGIDNRAAGLALGEHLTALGHRDVAAIMPDTRRNDRADERLAGLGEALAARGTSMRPQCRQECDALLSQSRAAMRSLLGLAPRPTAVACFSDLVGIAAALECRQAGVRVPHDMSIAGFSGIGLAELADPPLTTVSFSATEIGTRAAELVLARLAGAGQHGRVRVGFVLEPRASTASPPAVASTDVR